MPCRKTQLLVLIATALCASRGKADALGDARGALQRMSGHDPIHAVIELDRSRHSHGRFLNDDFDGSAVFDVDADASGLRVTYGHSLLERAATEDWAHQLDPARNAGTKEALIEAQPREIANAVDSAELLLRLVSRGRVLEERTEAWQGAPARKVALQLPNAKAGSDPGDVETSEDRLTMWIGRDGLPIGATRIRKGTAGMLFIHVTTVRTETWTFAARGDHLVATRFEDRSVVSGPGQHADARSVWSVKSSGAAAGTR